MRIRQVVFVVLAGVLFTAAWGVFAEADTMASAAGGFTLGAALVYWVQDVDSLDR